MNKLLLTGFLLLISSTALASKARLESLGQDGQRGSFYIEDFRSIFYNPAYLNLKKNAVITEWGKASDDQDTAQAPHAEGGILGDYGSFTFGAYFGSEHDSHNQYKNDKFLEQDNRLDFFFAGDAGMLWGIRAYYADNVDETSASGIEKNNTAYGLGLGAIAGNLESFIDVGLRDNSEGADASGDKWEGDLALRLGAVYRVSSFAFMAEVENFSFEQTIGSANDKGEMRQYRLAVAREYSVNKTAKIFADMSFHYTDYDFTGTSNDDLKGFRLPLNIAFETDLFEWLQARGSFSQTLISREEVDGKKTSVRNSTAVAAGLRYRAGKFNLDGIVGTTSSGENKGTFGTVSRIAIEYLF